MTGVYCGMVMSIDERTLSHIGSWSSSGATWFAASQPGIMRFFGDRLRGEALALGLAAARQISLAFEHCESMPAQLLRSASLERAEEYVLRKVHGQVPRGPYTERQAALIYWIAHLMSDPPVVLTPEERSACCQIVRRATILAWFRQLAARKYDSSKVRRQGRPRKAADIRELVVSLAQQNPGWGYTKIRDALRGLKIEIGRTTVASG